MLKMAQIQYIKHLYEVEEKSLSEIARLTNKNFRTVQKYAHCDDWSQESLPDLEPKSYPVLGNYLYIGWRRTGRSPESSDTPQSASMTDWSRNTTTAAATPA